MKKHIIQYNTTIMRQTRFKLNVETQPIKLSHGAQQHQDQKNRARCRSLSRAIYRVAQKSKHYHESLLNRIKTPPSRLDFS